MDDLDGLQVIHTPGHCAGQVAFLWPREGGVLFVGDAAANTHWGFACRSRMRTLPSASGCWSSLRHFPSR